METGMRQLLLAAATLATFLGIGVGNVEAASFALNSLVNSGVQTVDVRQYRRHPSYYYRRGGEIRRTPPVTATTATRFGHCSACGQKRIGREACGASAIAKVGGRWQRTEWRGARLLLM